MLQDEIVHQRTFTNKHLFLAFFGRTSMGFNNHNLSHKTLKDRPLRMSVFFLEPHIQKKYSLNSWEIPCATNSVFPSDSGYISLYIPLLVTIETQYFQQCRESIWVMACYYSDFSCGQKTNKMNCLVLHLIHYHQCW